MKFLHALISLLCAVSTSSAFAEGRVGNGGDAMAAEFVEMADDTLAQLSKLQTLGEQLPLSTAEFKNLVAAISVTKVFSKDKTLLEAIEVDAINYPEEHKIVLNRSRWRMLAYSLKSLKTIVMHEYLTLAGANDRSYQISTKLVRKIFNGGSTTELWYLKDLDDRRFTNPFVNSWLEIDGRKLNAKSRYEYSVHMQGGRIVETVVSHLPACTIELAQPLLPNAVVKAYILNANELSDDAVALDLGKPAIIKRIVCTAGTAIAKPTVGDMLDALDASTIVFNHQNPQTCTQ